MHVDLDSGEIAWSAYHPYFEPKTLWFSKPILNFMGIPHKRRERFSV